jgi:hypothetical protein
MTDTWIIVVLFFSILISGVILLVIIHFTASLTKKEITPSVVPNIIPIDDLIINSLISGNSIDDIPETSYLTNGSKLYSQDLSTYLFQQPDGKLVLYYLDIPVWATPISGKYPHSITLLSFTGSLLTYLDLGSALAHDANKIIWNSSSMHGPPVGKPGIYILRIYRGNFQVISDDRCIYASAPLEACHYVFLH